MTINVLYIKTSLSFENNIIFKVNDKPYTTLDIEKRSKYLQFVGENNDITSKEVLDDYISTILFYEQYIENNNISNELKNKVLDIYINILNEYEKKDKNFSFDLEKETILKNIELDFVRKIIIEEIINSQKDSIFYQENNLDLLYDYKISYLGINLNDIDQKLNLKDIDFKNILDVENYLHENNIKFFKKNLNIENLNNLNNKISKQIKEGFKFFDIYNDGEIIFVSIKKEFETYDGLIAQIFSFDTKLNMKNINLNCEYLDNNKDNLNILVKEYQFDKLNLKIKDNLRDIDDFIVFNDNNKSTYIFLCGIKFDREILNNINLNKKVLYYAETIEKEFIKNNSIKYNLIINE